MTIEYDPNNAMIRCDYCYGEFPEDELRKNLDNGLMCDTCWDITKEEQPEIVMPVYTAKDFDNRLI
jgi:hypothetical protein